jgi:hypothetical protein
MGLHFLNGDLLNEVNNGSAFDPTRPQIVLYEPTSDGRLGLVGADFLVFADAWDAKHPHDPPRIKLADIHARVNTETSPRNLVVNATVDPLQSTIRPNRVSAFTQVTIR